MSKFPWRRALLVLAVALAALLLARMETPRVIRVGPVTSPAGDHARLPRLMPMPDGGIIMSWVEPAGDRQHVLKYAVLREGQWVREGVVAQGGGWFVNWGDFPSVVAIDDTFWVAHWLVKQSGGGTYDYDIALAISDDAGMNWRPAGSPHRDGKAAEHGFASIFPDRGGAGILWLDGSDYVAMGHGHETHHAGNFALMYTRVLEDGSMEQEQVVDANTCTCCWPAVAAVSDGIVAAWRGRTDDEIRDNRVARLTGGSWTESQPLGDEGWRIAGCPVNGPALAARRDNVLAAWFTAEGDRPRVRAAVSRDGGRTFAVPVDLDARQPLGRIGALWLDDEHALVTWMANAEGKTSRLIARVVDVRGEVGGQFELGRLSAGRDSGVPQVAQEGDHLYLAWTLPEPEYGIVVGRVPLGLFR